MDKHCHLDWEVASELDLEDVGLDVWISHPSTHIIMANYAFGSGKIKRWEPHLNPELPPDLKDALFSPFTIVYAWHAQFERTVTRVLLGIDKPTEEWYCVQSHARYLSLPGKLHDAGEILNLGEAMKLRLGGGKTGKGGALVKFFCEPETLGGEKTLFGVSKATFRTAYTHPAEWETFCAYGGQDVVAERAALKKLLKFPWPEYEQEIWRMDQRINETGWPVDRPLVDGASFLVVKELEPLFKKIKEISQVANPNSRDQILGWLGTQGYAFTSLNKDFVKRAMDGECELTSEARQLLQLREQTSKSSVSKYTALSEMTGPGERLRFQYTYYGAHTGRWAAHGVNVGNLPKPSKQVEKNLNRAVELVRIQDYDGIVHEFTNPLEVVSSVLRSAFRAPKGYKFVVADLNSIENRGLGYLARCEPILDVFRKGLDPYLDFATRMYEHSYEELLAEYNAGDKTKRTICKSPTLGCGYGLGPGKEDVDKDGNKVFTGLRGYAAKSGVELTEEQAIRAVKVFRESFPEVKDLWRDMERAAAFAIRHPGQDVGVGVPHNETEEDYFQSRNRVIHPPILWFLCHGTRLLELKLPAPRSLFYFDPRVEKITKKWGDREYQQDCLYYKSRDQKTRQWVEGPTFGGHLVENADQAWARDILVHGMQRAEQVGFSIIGSTYDEIVTLCPVNGNLGVQELVDCMTISPSWDQYATPLGAAGFEDEIYRKD